MTEIPSLILKLEGGDLTPEAVERLKAAWRDAQKNGRIEIAPEPPGFKPLADLIAEAVAAERQRILSEARSRRRSSQGRVNDYITIDDLADLLAAAPGDTP